MHVGPEAGVCLVILSRWVQLPGFIGREPRKVPFGQGSLRGLLSLSQTWQKPPENVAGRRGCAGETAEDTRGEGWHSFVRLAWVGKGPGGPRLQTGSALRQAGSV